jgi:cell pole-organizing protein PopZ
MSAANASAPSQSLQEEMRAHEPSMEEILASIRRIIADDDSLPGARRERDGRRREEETAEPAIAIQNAYPAPALEPAPPPQLEPVAERPQPAPIADIRQLRLNRAAPEPVAEEPAESEDDHADAPESPAAALVAAAEAPLDNDEPLDGAPLVSAEAASSIASHFQALATSMFINDSGLLQKYAQEMLRPMLKQWLDDNLPVIVERLVRAEIERVARGGRR